MAVPVTSVSLRFESLTITVSAPEVDDLRWLAAFLDSGFEVVTHAGQSPHVALIVDAPGYDRVLRVGRPAGPRVEGFANDSKPAWFEPWQSEGSVRVFRDEQHPFFFVVADDDGRVTILARERTRQCRTVLMRVVRELAMVRAVSTGGLLVHGAAVGSEAGVVVMAGPRRSGKTTLLMALLQTTGVRYVANDRCVVRATDAAAIVRGLPTLVSIRVDALERFPLVRRRLASVRPDLAAELAPPVGGAIAPTRSRFSVSPPEFRELMGGSLAQPGGPLRAMVFPRITDAPAAMTLHRLDTGEAFDRVRHGLFRSSYSRPLGDVFVPDPGAGRGPSAAHAVEIARGIAESIPCYDAQLGRGLTPGPGDCRELVTRVASPSEG